VYHEGRKNANESPQIRGYRQSNADREISGKEISLKRCGEKEERK
jgi:hypothetical protein